MMEPGHLEFHVLQISAQILRHPHRQRRDQRAFITLDARLDLVDQIVDLSGGRANFHLGIQQSGRTDDLFDDFPMHLVQLIVSRRR